MKLPQGPLLAIVFTLLSPALGSSTSFAALPGLTDKILFRNCDNYPHGGLPGLKQDLVAIQNDGTECLEKLVPSMHSDALTLRQILGGEGSGQLVFVCGAPGESVDTGIGGAPIVLQTGVLAQAFSQPGTGTYGMALVIDPQNASPEGNPRSVLMHEMIHWLGYGHNNHSREMAYPAMNCCAPSLGESVDFKTQQAACKLLGNRDEWTSKEYQLELGSYMASVGRPEVGLNSALQAFYSSGGQLDPSVLLEGALSYANYKDLEIPSLVLAHMALANMPPEQQIREARRVEEALTESISRMDPAVRGSVDPALVGSRIGTFLGHALGSGLDSVKTLQDEWKALRFLLGQACGVPGIRTQLKSLHTHLAVIVVEQDDRVQAWKKEAKALMSEADRRLDDLSWNPVTRAEQLKQATKTYNQSARLAQRANDLMDVIVRLLELSCPSQGD